MKDKVGGYIDRKLIERKKIVEVRKEAELIKKVSRMDHTMENMKKQIGLIK